MSRFHGRQGRGAMRRYREIKRAEAERRQARERRHDEHRARWAVIRQYAKRQKTNPDKVLICTPSVAEQLGLAPRKNSPGNDFKIAYPDRESAEACAREMEAHGAGPSWAYPCWRSDSGHHHLSHTPRADTRSRP